MSGLEPSVEPASFEEERRPSPLLVHRFRSGSLGLCLLIGFMPLLGWTPWWMLWMTAGILLVFQWWLFATRFNVRLKDEVLSLRMAPFPAKKIPVGEIKAATTHMSYPWGIGKRGWSIKRSPGVLVFFTDPGAGLVLELESGLAVWLNSYQPEVLAALLKRRPKRKTKVKKALTP
ncbi:MAG: hypothetical protein O3A95_09965 [Planctomycetota bacterium]|nr:hypothetical protein [Planctomycetota bacterium]